MSSVTLMNYEEHEMEEMQGFEKISRREKAAMPVHRSRAAISASRKSPKSKSVSRKFRRSNSGTHSRRLRKFR